MTFSMMTEPVNNVSEVVLIRKSKTKLEVSTLEPLNDDQMRDIYWVTLAMSRTGLTLGEMIPSKDKEPIEPIVKDNKYYCGDCQKRISLKVKPRYCYKCGREIKL